MGLHYLTFMGRNLKNKKKPIPVRIMSSTGLNSKNIVNSVGTFDDIYIISNNSKGIILEWIVIPYV